MNEAQYQFDWDDAKGASNLQKHGVSLELASSIFNDPRILTIADLEHSDKEERWFSIGLATSGALLSVAYLWTEAEPGLIQIRMITARRAIAMKIRYYRENQ